jgi:hypothetical protein
MFVLISYEQMMKIEAILGIGEDGVVCRALIDAPGWAWWFYPNEGPMIGFETFSRL